MQMFLIINIMNRTERYRLLALMELARAYPEARPAAEIAARRRIPAAYLSRLLTDLAHAGWVRSRRGPAGGVALAKPPAAVPVTAVLGSGSWAEDLPPALARLAEIVSDAVRQSTEPFTIEDLVSWEQQSAPSPDYSI
jgi:DNA-binding IclR family transcriptional regulator